MSKQRIDWNWSKLVNQKFVDLSRCYDRYIILYGSRGSSKSDYVSKQLIHDCLFDPYFKCILYRKTYNTIQESSYETIKQNIISLGLESLFEFRKQPLSIDCINGNRFIARGGDNALSLKSIKDPSCVWYEEEVPDEEDFATITLTIRTNKTKKLREFFTINPQVEGDFTENWFWKRFFKGESELSFRKQIQIELIENGHKHVVTEHTTVHHSTYADNKWLPVAVKATIESYKYTNDYLYQVYAKGLWTIKQTGGNFYKNFDSIRHVNSTLEYDRSRPLHISFDFNVNPYMTCIVAQVDELDIKVIDEICLPYPRNTTIAICAEFTQRYAEHIEGVFVYGDPSGLKEYTAADTKVKIKEKDYDEYAIIMRELRDFRPRNRVARAYPAVRSRGDFINEVFRVEYRNLNIQISDKCSNLRNDFMYGKEAPDGTKHKEKVKNEETGVTYEKYFHCADAFDYMFCEIFKEQYKEYTRPPKEREKNTLSLPALTDRVSY